MTLPNKVTDNTVHVGNMPYMFHAFPIELLLLDDDFIASGALDDVNTVRRPDWIDNPNKLSYRGTFTMMGRVGTGTQWGVRNVETYNLWHYLSGKYGLKHGDYYMISNALPTFTECEGIKTFAKAAVEARALKKLVEATT